MRVLEQIDQTQKVDQALRLELNPRHTFKVLGFDRRSSNGAVSTPD